MLRDLLAMTQRREPQPADADLARFLKETTEPHREFAAAKGVSLQVAPVPGTIGAARFDIDQVRRALDNLILNAVQNTPPGGVVTVVAMADDGNLQLRVSDTGPGVPADIRERHPLAPKPTGTIFAAWPNPSLGSDLRSAR